MGCIFSVCGLPNGEQHIKIEPEDSMTLMIKNKEFVRIVKLRKSLDVVVVKRNNINEPVLIEQVYPERSAPREHQRPVS